MRIKWSSIPRMNTPNAGPSWVATATARVKYDAIEEQREREKREKERKQRLIAWLRRSRW